MQKIKGIFALTLFALPMLVACPPMEEDGGETETGLACDPENPTGARMTRFVTHMLVFVWPTAPWLKMPAQKSSTTAVPKSLSSTSANA